MNKDALVYPHSSLMNSPVNHYIKEGASNNFLAHYTSIGAFKQIFKNKQLKLNRIDKVNDLEECENLSINGAFVNVFVACFTKAVMESVPQWYMYTAHGNGVRIVYHLSSQLGECAESLIDYSKASRFVYYANDNKSNEKPNICFNSADPCINRHEWELIPTNAEENNNKIHARMSVCNIDYNAKDHDLAKDTRQFDNGICQNSTGVTKDAGWNFEEEVRIRSWLTSIDKSGIRTILYEYLLVPMKFDQIKKIEIVQSPWISEEQKQEVEEICVDYLKPLSIPYEIKSSKYYKKLKPR